MRGTLHDIPRAPPHVRECGTSLVTGLGLPFESRSELLWRGRTQPDPIGSDGAPRADLVTDVAGASPCPARLQHIQRACVPRDGLT